jgi:hypothetical protein
MDWWKTSAETMNSQQIDIVEHRFLLLGYCFCSCNIPQSGCWTDTCRLSVGSKHESHLRAAAANNTTSPSEIAETMPLYATDNALLQAYSLIECILP